MAAENPSLEIDYEQSANYRAAFPGLRVFIYGKEVTSDVADVRVSSAGGSLERTPGTCSITLWNPNDKYTINFDDVIRISKERGLLEEGKLSVLRDWTFDMPDIIYTEEQAQDSFKAAVGREISKEEISVLADELVGKTGAEIKYTLEAYGFSGLTEDSATAFFKDLEMYEVLNLQSDAYVNIEDSTKSSIVSLKTEVISDKIGESFGVADYKTATGKEDKKVIFRYPFQQGDSIFHWNDPIRIAFRDPFNPRMWYWKFSGFVDSFTEDVDTNNTSVLTIVGTDVSKVPRYSAIQLAGLLDMKLPDLIDKIASPRERTDDNAGITLNANIFRGLSIVDILEIIFFGSESLSRLEQLAGGNIPQSTIDFINTLYETEGIEGVNAYFSSNYNITIADVLNQIDNSKKYTVQSIPESFNNSQLNSLSKYVADEKRKKVDQVKLKGIVNPGGVSFKRKSADSGTTIYVYGEPDSIDTFIGAEQISSLAAWNEVIHHRVRQKDLVDMYNDGTDDGVFTGTTADKSVEDVITLIGTDIVNYPVGGGRVFYMYSGGLETAFRDISVFKRDTGSVNSHSTYKDRLSFLYDLAQNIDYRCYATPKGDFVFEMPFYDFDPDYFFGVDMLNDLFIDNSKPILAYEDVFQKEYDGNYATTLDDVITRVDESLKIDYFSYRDAFVIDKKDQISYSLTADDNGALTVYRMLPNIARDWSLDSSWLSYSWAAQYELLPILGFRLGEDAPWSFIASNHEAEVTSQLYLNRYNAEARNASINVLPNFGLMVNRPIYWKTKNYYATIVSLNDSISWNSDVQTTINVNQIRSWSGEIGDDNRPIFKHFGNSDRPFDLGKFLKETLSKQKNNKKSDNNS